MDADFEEHFDEEMDIITQSLWGNEDRDKLEILRRRAYYCATTERGEKFVPGLCPSKEEIEWVIAELNQSTDRRRSGRLLGILEYVADDWVLPSVVRFLDGPSPNLAWEALWILRGSEAVGKYADQVIRIMRGLPWDDVGSCQRLAMSCVDEYLYRHSDPRLLQELLAIYESEEYEEDVREEALLSLGRIVGINDLPEEAVLKSIRERLEAETPTKPPPTEW